MSATMAMGWMAPGNDRNLKIAIGVSLLLHALLLSLHFKYPDASRAFQEKALDIILVNAKSAHKPKEAQALAQANLDGGGTAETDRRAKTPLPASEHNRSGTDLEQAQKRVKALEAQQRKLMEQVRGKPVPAARDSIEEKQSTPEPTPSGLDLATSSMEMIRLQAEIAKQADDYNKRPRVKNIGTRTEEYRFARYLEDWRIKIERIGTLNYPDAAKGKLYGRLILSVRIKSDGSVERVDIARSSGHRILDDAAKRIVRMAEPFAAFPENIRRDTDIIEVERTWIFTKGDRLATEAAR